MTMRSSLSTFWHKYSDSIAIGLLIALWLLFFWRLFTPVTADQASLASGDFSRQFVTFGAYQYERWTAGEVPLWNPYNNGGLPFIADPQAAVFYPPRLLTIAVSNITGGNWTYNALQMEMTVHVLLYTLMFYTFMRRLTFTEASRPASILGAFVAAIIAGYGGFMTGYPPLQVALLEAAVWLPLALLGVLEATRLQNQRRLLAGLSLAGLGLGLSWMAGHPQTSWFATYMTVAFFTYRVFSQQWTWRVLVGGVAFMGVVTVGLAAVMLLPGFEYLARTMRVGLSFDAKAGGFPFQDVIQFIFPHVVSLWSPLYIGIVGLVLAGIALASTVQARLFWTLAALLSLGLSLGGNSVVFHALYNLLPGLSYFRGQERAAYLVSINLAVLAGYGTVLLTTQPDLRKTRRGIMALAAFCLVIAGGMFLFWLGHPSVYTPYLSIGVFSTLIAGILAGILYRQRGFFAGILVAALLVFELLSTNMDNINYESIPATDRIIMQTPPLVERVHQESLNTSASAANNQPFRVDGGMVNGEIGIYGGGNTGSLYHLQDIRGISPLFLDGPHAIIQRELPSEIAWELFAVRYVFTDAEELPITSELIARDYPDNNVLNLHKITDPRPFAHLIYDYQVITGDAEARAVLADPSFDPRNIALLHTTPQIALPETPPANSQATVTDFHPEHFTIEVNTSQNALLSVALVDYPGWQITLNGAPIDRLRAYGGLTAVSIPAGEHSIRVQYEPLSYRIGAVFSLLTWLSMGILVAWIALAAIRRR